MMRQSNLSPIILCISAIELGYLIISDKKKQLYRTLIRLIIYCNNIKKVVFSLRMSVNFLKKISNLLTTY
ncbi:unnamed protein product [Blepharisma stoltei]|uniref:Uncharacterized protein n=1 Tax=Blepharisma stoltei TaxID=1481888 RepID=A0AAU9J838_9CILI|nr:unnamed protein product [Blepharisma stoltei]